MLREGNLHLINAVKIANPNLSDIEAARTANIVLVETSKRIASGEQIAFVKPTSEGKVEVTTLGIHIRGTKSKGK
jgi:hypothetical protein